MYYQNGDTALHIAAALDKKSIVKKLLQWGADPAVRNHVCIGGFWLIHHKFS